MRTPLLLGVDVGTSSAKGAAFDRTGRTIAAHEVRYEYRVPVPGWGEADPEDWWRAVAEILRRLVAADRGGRIEGIGITGQAPTLLALGPDGRPLRPAILWLDVRSEAEAAAMAVALGPEAERAGGNRVHAYYLGPKLAWLRDHEPEVFAAATAILQSHSYPVWRLTGAQVTDYSSAALCVPLYDARSRRWAPDACARAGVPLWLLPGLRPAHAVAGRVTRAAARETGVPAGVPVVVGGADFAASTLAAGVTEPGEACLMLGTAGNLVMPFREGGFDTRLINAHHVGCDRYLALGATLAGAVVQWLRGLVAGDVSHELLDTESAAVPPGSEGLRFLPYLAGERTPVWDAGARGAFVGLTLAHGRAHLYRAALEAVAVSFRHCLEVMRERRLDLDEVVAVNGGARSPLWRQILADALDAPLLYLPDTPGAPAGAALLAGIGAGLLPGVEAAKAWRSRTLRQRPDPGRAAVYARLLAERLALYPALRTVA
jgi:xylulokinase